MSVERPGSTGPEAAEPTSPVANPPTAKRARGPKRTPRPQSGGPPLADPAAAGANGSDHDGNGNGSSPMGFAGPAPTDTGADADTTVVTVAPTPGSFTPIAPAATTTATATAPAPATRPAPTGRRGRRVKRVVRRVELWSVLKLSLVLYTCLYVAVLATLALVWGLAYSSGQIENLQKFLADVGLENYRFYGDQMFRACAAIGAVGVLAGTVVTVLTAALVNIISETTGGIRLVVIEEDVAPPR